MTPTPTAPKIGGRGARLPYLLAALVLGLVFLWPAAVDRYPFVMADTSAYVRGADAGFDAVFNTRSIWTDDNYSGRAGEGARGAGPLSVARVGDTQSPAATVPQSGRSIYYGALVYVTSGTRWLWITVAVQSLWLAVALMITYLQINKSRGSRPDVSEVVANIAVLAIVSPVAFFASYVLPDIFTALAILALANIVIFGHRDRRTRWFWFSTLVAALLFHQSNVLICIGLAGLAGLGALARRYRFDWAAAAMIAGALGIALLGNLAFSVGVRHFAGTAPVTPPFLTARLIADGPGRLFLDATCPASGYVACRVAPRGAIDSDTLLWSNDRSEGMFKALPPGDQKSLSDEQTRFVMAVARRYPLAVVQSALRNSVSQAGKMTLMEFNYHPTALQQFDQRLPEPIRGEVQRSAAYSRTMPVGVIEAVVPIATLVSMATILLFAARGTREGHRQILWFCILVLLGMVLNDMVCGALSKPHDRYQMRVLWLLPFLALSLYPVYSNRRVAALINRLGIVRQPAMQGMINQD